jgi:parallel beta-helix repeat protein
VGKTLTQRCAGEHPVHAKTRHRWPVRAAAVLCHRSIAAPLVVVAAVGLSLATARSAAALLVDKNDPNCSSTASPFCTISQAVAKAVCGNTVDVNPGTYSEKVTIPSSRSCTQSSPIVFSAQGDVTVTGSSNGFSLSGPKWITVRGFTISKTTSYGIYVSGASDITIDNNEVLDAGSHGIYVNNSPNVTVSGNSVNDGDGNGVGSVGNGIYIIGTSSNPRVADNYVSRAGTESSVKRGIYINNVGGGVVSGNILEANTDAGIYVVYNTTGLTVEGNTSFHNARPGEIRAAPGIDVRTAGNFVRNNITYENEDSGVQLYTGANNNEVTGNVTYDNGDHGIDVSHATNATVTGNSVCRNVTAGINLEGSATGGTVLNNTSVDNGIDSPRTRGNIRFDSTSTGVTEYPANVVGWSSSSYVSQGQIVYAWNSTKYKTLAALHGTYPLVEAGRTEVVPLLGVCPNSN